MFKSRNQALIVDISFEKVKLAIEYIFRNSFHKSGLGYFMKAKG